MMPIVITVILAVYGWAVIARIAKYRAASDLYNSAILLLEQLESDGEKAWLDKKMPWMNIRNENCYSK